MVLHQNSIYLLSTYIKTDCIHIILLGFYGEMCNKCITLPGCQHGYCNNSFECKCLEGWDGIFCSERNDDFLLKVMKSVDGALKLSK